MAEPPPPPYSEVVAAGPADSISALLRRRPAANRSGNSAARRSLSAERPPRSNAAAFARNSVFTSSGQRYTDMPPGWRPPPMPAVGIYPTATPRKAKHSPNPCEDAHSYNEELRADIQDLEKQLSDRVPYITELFNNVQQSVDLIASRKEVLLWELTSCKEELLEQIEEHFASQVAKLEQVHQVESRRLERNFQLVRKLKEDCERLVRVSPTDLAPGGQIELETSRDRLRAVNTELSAVNAEVLPQTSADEWAYCKPNSGGQAQRVKALVGYIDAHVAEIYVDAPAVPSAPIPEDRQPMRRGADAYISKTYSLLKSFSTKTYNDKTRCHPMSFVLLDDNRVLVPDRYNSKLKVFSLRGQLVQEITHPSLKAPSNVLLNLRGDILVSDTEQRVIHQFNQDGELVDGYSRLIRPTGMAMYSSGYLAVADPELRSVDLFTRTGYSEPVLTIRHYTDSVYEPQVGTFQKQTFSHFQCPHYLAVDDQDVIAVSDRSAHTVTMFKDGKKVASYGRRGKLIGQFDEPYGISYDSDGSLLVADYGNHRVQAIDMTTGKICSVLFPDLNLKFPTHVVQLEDGRLIVSEYMSGLIKVFGTADHLMEYEEAAPPAYSDIMPPPQASAAATAHSSALSANVPGQRVSSPNGEGAAGSGVAITDTNNLLELYHRNILRQNSRDQQHGGWTEWTL